MLVWAAGGQVYTWALQRVTTELTEQKAADVAFQVCKACEFPVPKHRLSPLRVILEYWFALKAQEPLSRRLFSQLWNSGVGRRLPGSIGCVVRI